MWACVQSAWGHWLYIALVTLQVYLHMVDPTRDRYLMNKSADVLVKTCGVRFHSPIHTTASNAASSIAVPASKNVLHLSCISAAFNLRLGVLAVQQVPPCWYQPVRNTGLVWDAKTGLVELKKEKAAKNKAK